MLKKPLRNDRHLESKQPHKPAVLQFYLITDLKSLIVQVLCVLNQFTIRTLSWQQFFAFKGVDY